MHSTFLRALFKVSGYMARKYDKVKLSTREAVVEMRLDGGRELESLLTSGKLKSLQVRDVAEWIVIHT